MTFEHGTNPSWGHGARTLATALEQVPEIPNLLAQRVSARPFICPAGASELVAMSVTDDPGLIGADDLEVLVDEDVVWPVDADVVDLVFAVAQLHNAIDDAPGVGG